MAKLKQQWLSEIDEFKDAKNYKVHVHTIMLDDVDDPGRYLAEPIIEWQKTERGKWVMEHSTPIPSYHHSNDFSSFGYKVHICAYLNEKDYLYYKLKYE